MRLHDPLGVRPTISEFPRRPFRDTGLWVHGERGSMKGSKRASKPKTNTSSRRESGPSACALYSETWPLFVSVCLPQGSRLGCHLLIQPFNLVSFSLASTLKSFLQLGPRERKISPKFFRPKFFHGRPRGMSVPKCFFFQDLEGLTEVFGRMSAGISAPKLPLWAHFRSWSTCYSREQKRHVKLFHIKLLSVTPATDQEPKKGIPFFSKSLHV